MGKQLDRNQSTLQFDRHYRGCIWGLFPLQFHSLRKLMPHRKHHDETSPKCGVTPQNNEPDDTEVLEARDADCVSPIKALFKGRTSRKNINKVKVSQRQRLERTYSIHHLEPWSCGLDDLTADKKHSVALQKIANTSEEFMYVSPALSHLKTIASYRVSGADMLDSAHLARKSRSRHFSQQDVLDHGMGDDCQSSSESSSERCEYEDFFDAFKIDKRLFMENKQKADADSSGRSHSLLKSERKAKFIRSGSFPMADQSFKTSGSFRNSKLEHKLTEAWPSFSSLSSSLSSSSFSSSTSSSTKTEDVIARRQSTVHETSEDLFGDLANSVNNKEVIHENTSQAAGDSGEPTDYISNVSNYRLKPVRRATSFSESDVDKYTQNRLRRAASFNDSLEKYTQLFETSFRRDAKFNVSTSLRLFSEDEVGLNLPGTKSFRRVHSLGDRHQLERSRSLECSTKPDKATILSTESYCHDQPESDNESRKTDPTVFETSTGFMEASSIILTTECASTTLMSNEVFETMAEEHDSIPESIIPPGNYNHQPQRDIYFSTRDLDEVSQQEPYPVSEYSEDNDKWCAAPTFEGLEHRLIDTFLMEPMILDELPTKSVVDAHSDPLQHAKDMKSLTRDKDLDTENNNDFICVQNALKQIGAVGTTHSLSKTTTSNKGPSDKLLLDLVTEVLLDVYEGCDAYWPSSLCKNSRFRRPPPTDHHVSKMVWSKIKKLQCFSHQSGTTIDSVVGFDLAGNDGCLNLQANAESLGLAMEELICDELIEELIYE